MKIAFACGWRYEPEWLLDDWKENTKWADFHIVVDDRGRDPKEKWDNETLRYIKYREIAIELGADWLFVTAPDERLAPDAEQIVRKAMLNLDNIYYDVRVLELYTPTQYRCDKFWDNQYHATMYRIQPNQQFTPSTLHANPVPTTPYLKPLILPTDIYHLKHIEPESRKNRIKIFKEMDPEEKMGGLGEGYDYLDDDEGIELCDIPKEKQFYPPYRKPYIFDPDKVLES